MNVPKKILFVGSFPPPFGGIASHLSDLFETYKKENEHFYIYDLDKNINKKDEGLFHFRSLDKLGNILLNPIYIFTFFKNIKGFYFSITFLMSFIVKGSIGVKAFLKILLNLIRLINTVKEFKISVISTYHIFPEGIYPYLLKKNFFPDLKYSITVFGELQADTVEIDKYKKVYTDILQNADLVMASIL
jgi:hypothetical protein